MALTPPMRAMAMLVSAALLFAASASAGVPALPARFAVDGKCAPRFETADKVAFGIDVSKYQGKVDWNAVVSKTGVLYMLVRASEGLEADPQFAQNWNETDNLCLLRAPYHFFEETVDATAQAKSLYSLLQEQGALDSELPVVADIERASDKTAICGSAERAKSFVTHTLQFLRAFESAAGRKMMIYTSNAFWNCLPDATDLARGRDLWVAEYTEANAPRIPSGWTTWQFWQFYDKGQIAGIKDYIDANRFNGNGEQLLKFAGPR